MSVESSSWERVIWPESEEDGSPDILFGDGEKVSVDEVGEREGEFISVVRFDTTGVMSKY